MDRWGWESQTVVAPLGVQTTFIADDPRLLAAARAACPDSPAELHQAGNRIAIRLETASIPSSNLSCRIEVEGSRIAVRGPDFEARGDAKARTGVCRVPLRLALDQDALASELLDPILLFLLARSGRTPIHAAGIMIDGRAVLLAGASGSGKSSLAHAAARRGIRVLSDDTIYIQLDPDFRVWGMPRPIHLMLDDAPPGQHPIRLRSGRTKASVSLPAQSAELYADDAALVVLERGSGVALGRLETDAAKHAMSRLEAGFDLLPEESREAAGALAGRGAWRLTLGSRPDDAIDLLLADLQRLS